MFLFPFVLLLSFSQRLKPQKPREFIIDREGKTDEARYKGFRAVSDDDIAQQLEMMRKSKQDGSSISGKKNTWEESYVQPFSDKNKVRPANWQPEWTPEMIDEEGRRRGETYNWARKAREEKKKIDPAETLSIEGGLRVYSILSAVTISFAYGKASPAGLDMIGLHGETAADFLFTLQGLALSLIVASIGSSVVSSVILAPEKNRSSFVWAVKGLAGGPLAILQLRSLGSNEPAQR